MNLVIILTIVLHVFAVGYSSPNENRVSFIPQNPSAYPESTFVSKRTVLKKSLNKVLSRRKRFFVFVSGSLMVITDVAAKHMLARYPRILVESNEIDLFYDLPLGVDGWRKPLNEFVKGVRAQIRQDQDVEENEKFKNVGVVNVSAIPEEIYNMPGWKGHQSYYRPQYELLDSNRRNYQDTYRRPYYNTPNRTPYYQPAERRQYTESQPSYQNNRVHSSNTQTPSWHHHREYRERRDIYEYIDKVGNMLGRSLRKCIMRAICEMKRSLLPEGTSLINDIARIIFTVPTDHDDKEDEFTQIALEDNVDCKRRFLVTCPHSPLEYVLKYFAKT